MSPEGATRGSGESDSAFLPLPNSFFIFVHGSFRLSCDFCTRTELLSILIILGNIDSVGLYSTLTCTPSRSLYSYIYASKAPPKHRFHQSLPILLHGISLTGPKP